MLQTSTRILQIKTKYIITNLIKSHEQYTDTISARNFKQYDENNIKTPL